jgi:peptidoglycan DL-endopeptidase RipA
VHGPTDGRSASRRIVAAVATTVTALGLLIAVPDAVRAAPTPPPNPTNGQLNAAHAAQDAVAAEVGRIGGEIAQKRVELDQARGRAEQAEQKYANAISKLRDAEAAAKQAQAQRNAAQQQVARAHDRFVQYIQASYMSGDVEGTAGSLLTADNPSDLLAQSALEQYQQAHQADAIGALQSATVAKSNADARARAAVKKQQLAKQAADDQKQIAFRAVTRANAEEAALEQTLSQRQAQLQAAETHLADLRGQRRQYEAFQAEQARLARIKAAHERELRRQAAARAAAERRKHQHHSGGGGGGGGGGGSTYTPGPSAPSGGSWTAARGRAAANRALSQLGSPYAWAGGGVGGPSYGVCDSSNGAPNDCNVRGYDCSGLVLYGWGRHWDHYAATQYSQAGSYHPSPGNLRAGDLLFWSSNGRVSGIHHVAIAIGGGRMVEAPYSGGYVQTASIYEYGGIDFTTRPLT